LLIAYAFESTISGQIAVVVQRRAACPCGIDVPRPHGSLAMPATAVTLAPSLRSRLRTRVKQIPDRFANWVNWQFGKQYGGDMRPAFFDIDKTYPSLRILDENYAVIRAELDALLVEAERIPRYHDVARNETYISGTINPEKAWRVFMLRSFLGELNTNEAKCPQTTALLRKIPNVLQAFFSILEPGKPIPAHNGPYLGYLRYHLGLRVPTDNPPSIRIKDQHYTWVEGQSVMFDDSWNHEVYNKSTGIRVVLIVDVFRPMPLQWHLLNWALTQFWGKHTEESKLVLKKIRTYS
jgi:hypothetical protein